MEVIMNYYNEIKKELINNELNKKVKDYSKNKYEIQKYYNVGKLLLEAGNNYGEGIIKEYSKKLTNEIGKKYNLADGTFVLNYEMKDGYSFTFGAT